MIKHKDSSHGPLRLKQQSISKLFSTK